MTTINEADVWSRRAECGDYEEAVLARLLWDTLGTLTSRPPISAPDDGRRVPVSLEGAVRAGGVAARQGRGCRFDPR